jgi:tetratricopeptide (TPR) repeat protein
MKRSLNDKDPRKAYLNSLWLFGHDPDNATYIEGIVRNAGRLRAEDAGRWAAGVHLRALESNSKTTPKQFQALAKLLEDLGDRAVARGEAEFGEAVYRQGVETLNLWQRRSAKSDVIDKLIKDLSTKLTIHKGRYQESESFRESIVDADEQADLHDRQRTVQAEERVDELIAKALEEYQSDLDNADKLRRLSDLLCRRERDEDELQAIGLLVNQYKRTGEYRWKHLADDIRIRQLGRHERIVAKSGERERLKEQRVARLRFELGVFRERVERYPTDNRVRFEYGVRNFEAGRFDEAIPLFQTARNDPRNRALCGLYLGRCFYRKGYFEQAIATLEEAAREYEFSDDDSAKNMLYWLGRSQEAARQTATARATYGRILQIDYNFRDVRVRLDQLPA